MRLNIYLIYLYRTLMVLHFMVWSVAGYAQQRTGSENDYPVSNYKILEQHKDKEGNLVRKVRYDRGRARFTETQVIRNLDNPRFPINADTVNKDSVLLIVNKSRFEVAVYYRRKLVRKYRAVFGPRPQDDKKMEGDRCTPEGMFAIQTKNAQSKYNKFLLLNYPNDTSYARFNSRKQSGQIPRDARIGGSVGIHGVWKGGDDMIEKGIGWTDGCVAICNRDIDELYALVGIGTRVYIRK